MGTEEEKKTNINNFKLIVMKKNRIWIYPLYTLGTFIMFLSISFKSDAQVGSATVKDMDGNVYKTVKIGTQVWMAENVKTTKYNDGTPIPLVRDDNAWESITTPAYCWHKNDATANKNTYGALYNWDTVNSNKLCPSGWHVPSDVEWSTLITFLGSESIAGGKLKEAGTAHWISPNTGTTNESGFTALPGGYRDYDGTFGGVGDNGFWWSSTDYTSSNGSSLDISFDGISIHWSHGDKQDGFSVRCIKD